MDISLIGKYLAGEALPEEALAIHEWKDRSPENGEVYQQVFLLWSMSHPVDVYEPPSRPVYGNPRGAARQWASWRIAAALLLVIGMAALCFLWTHKAGGRAADNIVLAASGKILSGILPDRSTVVLANGSRLAYADKFSGGRRAVELEGEGYFSIKPIPREPFLVKAGKINVLVLGTEFNVKTNAAGVKVQVSSGKVMMYNDRDSLVVKAGMTGLYDNAGQTFRQLDTVHKNDFAYATGTLYFDDLPMGEVKVQLEAAYNIRIVYENDSLTRCRLNTQFKRQPLKEVLDVIASSLDIQYRMDKDTVYFYGHGCN